MARRPAADPALFGDALPTGKKPYTGSPDIVEQLVVRVATAAQKFAEDTQAGVQPKVALPALQSEMDAVSDVFLGRNDDYEVLHWHKDGGLPKHLSDQYGMDGESDPVGGYLAHFALSLVRLHRKWTAGEMDDAQTEAQVGGLKVKAIRDLLGLPDESVV